MVLALALILIAVILFLAKSKIPNDDLERLANIASLVIFIFGVISLIWPLSSISSIELFQNRPTSALTPASDITVPSLLVYNVSLTDAFQGCELKELVANFDAGETLSISYQFTDNIFSKPYPGHVGFILKGADFEKDFKVDETLSYSMEHKIVKAGEYRVGIIWHGRYNSEVKITLPNKTWQIEVSVCVEK